MALLSVMSRVISRLEVALGALRTKVTIPRWIVAPVVVLLVGLSLLAWRQLPPDRTPSYPLLGIVALLGMVSLAINSIEFRVTAVLAQTTVPPLVAMRTVLAGTIANVLPLPGSQLVRVGVLHARGVTLRRAVTLSLLVGFVWILVAAVVALPLLILDVALVAVGPTLVVVSVVAVVVTRFAERCRRVEVTVAALIVTECSLVLFQVVRLVLIGRALGIDVDLTGSAALTLAATVATGAALLPSGLGLREGLSVLVGPLGGIGRSESLLMSVFDQAIAYSTFALIAVALVAVRGRSPEPIESAVPPATSRQDSGSAM